MPSPRFLFALVGVPINVTCTRAKPLFGVITNNRSLANKLISSLNICITNVRQLNICGILPIFIK